MLAADAKMAPEATYQTGDMKFSANVNAEYDLVTGALIGRRLQRLGDIRQQTLVLRLGRRRITAAHQPIATDQELLEIPFDVAAVAVRG